MKKWSNVTAKISKPRSRSNSHTRGYAWNKPGLMEMRIIVRIPDRFSKLI